MRIARRDFELASLGRRLAAASVDAACLVGLMAGTLGATVAWDKARDRGALEGLTRRLERWKEVTGSPWWHRAATVVSVAAAVPTRNWRTPGKRVMQIRRADVRTGGPVTMRSALICQLVGSARGLLLSRLVLAPRFARNQAEIKAIQGDLEQARAEHPDDARARQQAEAAVYRAKGVNPFRGCSLALIIPPLVNWLVILATPQHQSPEDWLAGIVTVRD